MSAPLWYTVTKHTTCSNGFEIWFRSNLSAEIGLLFYIQNFRKLTDWFSRTRFFNVTDCPFDMKLLSENISGVNAMAASRIALYWCLSSNLTEDVHNFLMFTDIYVHTLQCCLKIGSLQWWPFVVSNVLTRINH